MELKADIWYTVQFNIQVPSDVVIDDVTFMQKIAVALSAISDDTRVDIDNCKVWDNAR